MRRVLVQRVVSYLSDWIILVIAVVVFQRIGKIRGHRQAFSLNDITIQFDYTGPSTVSGYALVLLSVALPAATIAASTILLDRSRTSNLSRHSMLLHYLNTSWLGLALSICVSQVFTNVLKIVVGRPRPDMLARCLPSAGAVDTKPYGLSSSSVCTQTNVSLLNDGFRSFPSGHSSMAFSGLAYLTLYLAWRTSLFGRKDQARRGEVWKWVLVLLPFMAASFVAASRILDNRHHSFDVLFGSFIGIVTSLLAFHQYHPSLHDVQQRLPLRFSEDASASRLSRERTTVSESGIPLNDMQQQDHDHDQQSSGTTSPEIPYNAV